MTLNNKKMPTPRKSYWKTLGKLDVLSKRRKIPPYLSFSKNGRFKKKKKNPPIKQILPSPGKFVNIIVCTNSEFSHISPKYNKEDAGILLNSIKC